MPSILRPIAAATAGVLLLVSGIGCAGHQRQPMKTIEPAYSYIDAGLSLEDFQESTVPVARADKAVQAPADRVSN